MSKHQQHISQLQSTGGALYHKLLGLPTFEGWYLKLTAQETEEQFIVIFGFVRRKRDAHAFIQLASSHTTKAHYVTFPIADLKIDTDAISIGPHYFDKTTIHINLPNFKINVAQKTASTALQQHGVIGFKKYVPFVNCKHDILEMDAIVGGEIYCGNHRTTDQFNLYVETTWGSSFPKNYFWLHANRFKDHPTTSFLFAQAYPSFLGVKSKQLIGSLIHQGERYDFHTHTTRVDFDPKNKRIQLKSKKVTVLLRYSAGKPIELLAPLKGSMEHTILEHIHAPVSIHLTFPDTTTCKLHSNLGTWEYALNENI